MREILFRGKTRYGEWVEFDIIHEIFGDFIQPIEEKYNGYDIIPETIGQYTGLTDKNGVKIFEGDLCLCNRNINDRFDKTVFEIKYDEIIGFYGESKTENTISADEFFMCEIVGNVFDNLKLSEGKQ